MDNVDIPVQLSRNEQELSIDEQMSYMFLQNPKVKNSNTEKIVETWIDTYIDYNERYNKILDEMCGTYNDLLDTMEYVANIKVPFCWEYVRCSFANELHEILQDFQKLDVEISSFMNEMTMCRMKAIERADIKLSDSAIEYLENLLGHYAYRSSLIREDLTHLKKQGINAFISSQQLSSNCGDLCDM